MASLTVSVIIPCYNEEATIGLLLNAVHEQTFPREKMEIVIADGLSTDDTRVEIAAFQKKHPNLTIKIIDNVDQTIPSGLNRAIDASSGEFIIRLDAHSEPAPEYVQQSIDDLKVGLGENVGGVWKIRPGGAGWIAQAIAVAAAHPIGVGDAKYRLFSKAQAVDTVPFGAFRRTFYDRIGGFDETLLANEDYEFNARVRQSGGTVWLDPKIHSIYYARNSLKELAIQYWRYGYWKVRMLARYPGTIRWRQALPPLFVASLGIGFLTIGLQVTRWILGIEVVSYVLALLTVGVKSAVNRKKPSFIIGVPLAIATMHLFWGSAFLWSMVDSLIIRNRQ